MLLPGAPALLMRKADASPEEGQTTVAAAAAAEGRRLPPPSLTRAPGEAKDATDAALVEATRHLATAATTLARAHISEGPLGRSAGATAAAARIRTKAAAVLLERAGRAYAADDAGAALALAQRAVRTLPTAGRIHGSNRLTEHTFRRCGGRRGRVHRGRCWETCTRVYARHCRPRSARRRRRRTHARVQARGVRPSCPRRRPTRPPRGGGCTGRRRR